MNMNLYSKVIYSVNIAQPSEAKPERIESLLKKVDENFYEHLNSRVVIKDYAEKLSQRATNIFILDASVDIAHAAFYSFDHESKIFLSSIAVISEYEGKGVGCYLLDVVENYSINHEVSIIELEVDSRSSKLKEFYKKRGFETKLHSLVDNKIKMTKLIT